MTTIRSKPLLLAACCVALLACREAADPKTTSADTLANTFETDTLVIRTDDGASYEFTVYLAEDPLQQRRGLMFVRSMAARTGMLFVYEETGVRSIWMKNTYIPLDLVFARRDGSVSSVVHDTQPLSLISHSSTEPVNYVLELNAGTARRLHIGRDSQIIWKR